jgi:hypothetical protein
LAEDLLNLQLPDGVRFGRRRIRVETRGWNFKKSAFADSRDGSGPYQQAPAWRIRQGD